MLVKLALASLMSFSFMSIFSQTNKPYLLIGTYTSGKSEGIYVYNFNSITGENSLVSTVKASNPSYLAVSPNNNMVYAVTEDASVTNKGTGGDVIAFSFNKKKGTLTQINKQFSGGKHPCYVSVDKTGKWVFAGNYSSGNAAVFAVKKDGSLDTLSTLIQHTGSGPNKDRQTEPHVHSTVISPDNKFLFVPDLGIDKVMIYQFNNKNGKLIAANPAFAQSTPGSGPRHFDFHPTNKYAYLMEELTATVSAFKYSNGKLTPIQRISAMPTSFSGALGSADIHVSQDGKFLYCSNRGESNSISIFKINAADGRLKMISNQPSMGKTPRNFNFDPTGNFLLVAHQQSDEIVIFKIDKKTGLLTDTGKRINVPNPVCIKWIK